jgi:tetratricopeptide (TPR) repeat protein
MSAWRQCSDWFRSNAPLIAATLRTSLHIAKQSLLLLLAVYLCWYVWSEARRQIVVIDNISVPKQFDEVGLTSQVLTSRVRDALAQMESKIKTFKPKEQFSFGETPALFEFEIPETNFSVRTLVELAQQLFHSQPEHLHVEIVFVLDPQTNPQLKQSEQPGPLATDTTVQLIRNQNVISVLPQVRAQLNEPELAVEPVAENALQITDPYVYAVYLFTVKRDSNEAEQAIQHDISTDCGLQTSRQCAADHDLLGDFYGEEGHFDQSITEFQTAIREDGHWVYPYYNWGIVLSRQKQYADAISKFDSATKIDPSFSSAYDNWGIALKEEQKPDEAIAIFRRAIKANPKDAMAFAMWGVSLDQDHKYTDAIIKYQKAISVASPDQALTVAIAYDAWGMTLEEEKNFTEALPKYELATTFDPGDKDGYRDAGDLLELQGKTGEAIIQYQKALPLDPGNAELHFNFGLALADEKETPKAIEQFTEAIKLQPNYSKAYKHLGEALDALGEHAKAVTQYEKAIRISQDDSDAYNALAYALAEEGRFNDALGFAQKAFAMNPADPAILDTLGFVLVGTKRYQEAISDYRKAVNLKPDEAIFHFHLAQALRPVGQKKEADSEFAAAFRLDPTLQKQAP